VAFLIQLATMIKKLLVVITLFVAAPAAFLLYSPETEYQNLLPDTIQQAVAPDYESIPLTTQVGQLFAVGHWVNIEASTTAARVRDLQLGSVIIMSAPDNESAVSDWADSWQEVANIPLIISIDQEGGVVSRLRSGNHTQVAQSEITVETTAYEVANKRAVVLQTLGINANYAPVMDRSISPDAFMYPRVFRDPTMIAPLADAMVRGYQDNGVVAVPKHFPGHPDTSDDSHITLPRLDLTVVEYAEHTQQFADIVETGNVEMLMTAHVLVPALDPSFPATVSPIVIRDLRERIGYDGVVITDDLAMQAISDRWSYEESAVMALAAGVDMVMLAAEPEHASSTVQAVIEAVEQGELPRERVFEAYSRVMRVKESLE
jgi:beta-N-acetylhexosaminidase